MNSPEDSNWIQIASVNPKPSYPIIGMIAPYSNPTGRSLRLNIDSQGHVLIFYGNSNSRYVFTVTYVSV